MTLFHFSHSLALFALVFSASTLANTAQEKVTLITNYGAIVLELDREKAPRTVENFLQYVKDNHYDGTIFHRVIDGFMIQGGGFTADMTQKPTRGPIPLESRNGLTNSRGTIAMARTSNPNSTTAQFFVNVVDNNMLNAPNPDGYGYTVFGKVVKGIDIVDEIKAVPVGTHGGHQNVPLNPVIIHFAVLGEAKDAPPPPTRITEPKSKPPAEKNSENILRVASTGSGFSIKKNIVITNNHVIEGCAQVTVNGKPAQRLASDRRNDLAVLRVELSGEQISIRKSIPLIGETIIVAGYPLHGILSSLNITTGNISSMVGIRGDTTLFQMTAPIQPGNSGGPVFDTKGQLIGVVVSKLNSLNTLKASGELPQNINFAINSSTLKTFLSANQIDFSESESKSSMSTPAISSSARNSTHLIECLK